ncbi:MAG: molybdopterin molybdotransferase MoeA [Sphingomonadaceae bacterium]|nr:molybdopterin molybdotransferase MoeA [Sphingomonadaceae bacterium]
MSGLLPVDEAQSRLLGLANPLDMETAAVGNAAGRWLAEDVKALRTQPAADLSAMDGYALRFDELPGPLTVIGESAAGSPLGKAIGTGEAARIFTGAPVPEGADTVMVQEEALREGDELRLDGEGPAQRGANIRRKGRDFADGDVLLHAGERLTAPRIGLAITAGHGELPVRRVARLSLISTGDELVMPGMAVGDSQIPASNGPMLVAQLAALPVDIVDHGIVPDSESALADTVERARDADIIVTIGGASVGDYDLVHPVFTAAGATFDFLKIRMKPGKPLMAGKLGSAVVVGLPGNPASAFVTAKLFLEPLIAHLSGAAKPLPVFASAPLAAPLRQGGSREEYLRGRWRSGAVEAIDQQSSAAPVALADAEFFIRRKPGAPAAAPGDKVDILPVG